MHVLPVPRNLYFYMLILSTAFICHLP